MRFDLVLGNPPYNYYQQFFNLAVESSTDIVSFVMPATELQNRKDTRKTNAEKMLLENVQHYETVVKLYPPSVFSNARVFVDIVVVTLRKQDNSNKLIKELTYKNGNTHKNIPLETINILEIEPELYSHIRKKFIDYIIKNGSLRSITKPNEGQYGAYIQSIRGDLGQDTFFSIISNNPAYHLSSKEKTNGQVIACEPEELPFVFPYLKTFVARFGLALSKINGNIHQSELNTVPLVPFDRIWTDVMLQEKLGLTDTEMNLIYSILPDYHGMLTQLKYQVKV